MLSKVPAPPLPAILTALRSSSLGQPVVTNGLPLSKIHHGAFGDRHRPGFPHPPLRGLLELHDGLSLELRLKAMAGALIKLPRRTEGDRNSERLALRFEEFRRSA
jgi:putative restriction endonuclease